MPLTAGSLLGPYEIVAPLGAGGMGEVYRGRDSRIGREVAIKILPRELLENDDRRRRFEQEARAAGSLNHPNLLVIHDLGTHEGQQFIVSELLEGQTLREVLLEGAISFHRATEYAVQMANGLAAAHEKNIVHRDLKPENIFITSDERVKLLDFGLAKLIVDSEPSPASVDATLQRQTDPGTVLGTVGYMAPEQIRGEAVDPRADIFSLGVVLAEMIGRKHPFERSSSIERLSAVLRDDPELGESVSPAARRLLEHMLAKQPSRRFQTMKDVSFALELLSGSSESSPSLSVRKRAKKKVEKRAQQPEFRRVTFRRGSVSTARFAPDGSVVYGAAWGEQGLEVFTSYPGTPESRPLGLPGADVLAVSRKGELAISLNRRFVAGWATSGTLARAPLAGGPPREIREKMQDADWDPAGKEIAIIAYTGESFAIEYPLGKKILETGRWISHLRFSPKGDRIAFIEHPLWGDDSGRLTVVDLDGNRLVESPSVWNSTAGIAWTPRGDEVWIAAEPFGAMRSLIGLSMSGRERMVLSTPSRLTLHDISSSGDVLIAHENARREILAGIRGEPAQRNLSWFDWSFLSSMTSDGTRILFEEQGVAKKGELWSVYLRTIDGAPAIHLGDGRGRAISWDGRWIAVDPGEPATLEIVPTGAGQSRRVTYDHPHDLIWWYWFPDGKRLLLWGNEAGGASRMYQLDIETGQTGPIGPERVRWPIAIAPDGTRVAATGPDHRPAIFSTTGDDSTAIAGATTEDKAVQWSEDGRALFTYRRTGDTGRALSVMIDRIDVESGERSEWQELRPSDPAGVLDIMPVLISSDGQRYAFGYRTLISDLFIVSGLL